MSTPFTIHPDRHQAIVAVAEEMAALIQRNSSAVLGLATGATPIPLYKELIRLHQQEGLSFAKVKTFNLDEYQGLPRDHAETYWSFMRRNFFDHLDIAAHNIHLPLSLVPDEEIPSHCVAYERAIRDAGGIDYQILGIGRTGHIGFNEPGSPADSRTRCIQLDEITRQDAALAFGGLDQVPTQAITMGCGTILEAKHIALMAFGTKKSAIVAKAIHGPITDQISASFLQRHPQARFHLDPDSGIELT